MKPMLAVNAELSALRFPVIGSPKLDGVRALVVDGKLLSRTFIPIPNASVRARFESPAYAGFDGELIVGSPVAPDALRATLSAVSRNSGAPDVKFYVFDLHDCPHVPFTERLARLRERANHLPNVVVVLQEVINDLDELAVFENTCVEMGFEGVILRKPNSPYKHGRSTVNEGYMLKVKRWSDSEAEIVGVLEGQHNGNVAGRDNFGRTKRSSCQGNKTGKGTVGAFQVRDLTSGVEFDCSLGSLSADEREALWTNRSAVVGRIIKYRYIAYGVKDKPKSAQFQAFRERWDFDEKVSRNQCSENSISACFDR